MSSLGLALLLLAAVFFAAFLASVSHERRRRHAARDRLRALAKHLTDPRTDEESIIRERMDGFRLDATLARFPVFRRLELLLYRAGVSTPAWQFGLLSLGLGLLAALATLKLTPVGAFATVVGAAAALLPWFVVAWRKKRRMQTFEMQFPEALSLICRALRAGHTLSAGLRMVGESLEDPIGGEFQHVADEIALGLDIRVALANLCHRIDVADLTFFSTAVLIQRETGGNLAEIMEKLGYVIRERHQLYGKVKAMTAQNRGAAFILLCTPAAFLLLMNAVSPDFIDPLFHTHAGRMLGLVCFVLTIAGYLMARRLAVVRA